LAFFVIYLEVGRGIFFLPRQFKSVLAFREVFLYKSQPNSFGQQINKSKSIENKIDEKKFWGG
jgi:hypothetical protein